MQALASVARVALLLSLTSSLALAASSRVETLFATRPESRTSMAEAMLETFSAEPEETKAVVYMAPKGQEGVLRTLDLTRIRVHPWHGIKSFVAFRFRDKINGSLKPTEPWGDIEFWAPKGEDIQVGKYENAQEPSFAQDDAAGLRMRGVCAGRGGSFEILKLRRNSVLLVDRLAATFETEECHGFVAYHRGTEDDTGNVGELAQPPRPSKEPVPGLEEVIAAYAQDDEILKGFEPPEADGAPLAVIYAKGQDNIARGESFLHIATGDQVKINERWQPAKRVVDVTMKIPAEPRPIRWETVFFSAIDREMQTGNFRWAGNFPHMAAGFPGIGIRGLGRGCALTGGRFRVLEAKYIGTRIERFAAEFLQHCEGWGPPLKGFFLYRSGL